MKFSVLVFDDEEIVCNSLKRILEDDEKHIFTATRMSDAQKILESHPIDLVLLDYKLKDRDGISVLKELKERYADISVVIITAFGNIDLAVEAMKLGAYDFIQKKEEPEYIRFTVKRALDNLRLKKEVQELQAVYQKEKKLPELIHASKNMRQTFEFAGEYAKTDTTVLITGETGTGKNLLGQYIHFNSPRFTKPYIPINCAAIPHELIESELFGYEKGAFTGAHLKGKRGLIEQADGGTLFFDEISELNLDLQSKLLHILERNEFYRVGAVNPTKVDVRFIAATNSNLEELVRQKQFRMDLFYRLNVATLRIPSLRERKEDIIALAKIFIEEFNMKFNKSVNSISKEAGYLLENAHWQGNVRELRNTIERAMLLKKNNILEAEDLKSSVYSEQSLDHSESIGFQFDVRLNGGDGVNILQEAQKELVFQALTLTNQNRSKAAKLLGIPRTSLNFYIKKYQI